MSGFSIIIEGLINNITSFYKIKRDDFFSTCREAKLAEARQLFAYILRNKFKLSFPAIGNILDRDHTTIMHSCEKINLLIHENKPSIVEFLEKNEDLLKSYLEKREINEIKTGETENIKLMCASDDNLPIRIFEDENKDGFVNKVLLPIDFNATYIDDIFNKIDNRTGSLITTRYGLYRNKLLTLEDLAVKEKLSRERIRQIIECGIRKLCRYNYGGIGQIVQLLQNQVKNNHLLSIDHFLKQVYIVEDKDNKYAKNFILVVASYDRSVAEFELSGKTFFIEKNNEKNIFDYIDNIKVFIKKVEREVPDNENNRFDYICKQISTNEYFENKHFLLDYDFLKACYDNYLFESDVVFFKSDILKKYSVKNNFKKISGIPETYKIFFE